MPAHLPQAAQARRSSAMAFSPVGAPSLGLSVLRSETARRKFTPQRATSSGVLSAATMQARAKRTAASSVRSVGNLAMAAACGMARKFGQSPVKNGRGSWTLDADAVNTGRTPAALSPTIERLPSYYVDGNVKVTLGALNMRRYVAMVELSPYFGVQTPVWRE